MLIGMFASAQQTSERSAGAVALQNYYPQDYGANPQIFFILQDNRGLMYIVNQKGVLEYDGVSWRTIPISDGEVELRPLCLEKDEKGIIHVGANGEYGVILPNTKGQLEYQSLVQSTGIDSIGRVAEILIKNEVKYLRTTRELLVIRGEEVTRIGVENDLQRIFWVDGKLYVSEKDAGLFTLNGDQLVPVENGYQFANKEIELISEFDGRKLAVTVQNGIFELKSNGDIVRVFEYTDETLVSCLVLNDEYLSLGTYSKGIIVLDKEFNIVNRVGLSKGITDASIKFQYQDYEGNLWLGTNNGLSKVEINAPILSYAKNAGLKSGIEDLVRFNGSIFLAAQDGVYQMGKDGFLKAIDGIERDCYGMREFQLNPDTLLFIAELNSVLGLDKNFNVKEIQGGGPYDFKSLPGNKNEIVVLHYDGIAKLNYNNGEFTTTNYIRNFCDAEPFNFLIQEDGTIWIGTIADLDGGVYKTHLDVFKDSTVGFDRFYQEEGIPAGATYMVELNDHIYCATDNGLFKYEDGKFTISDEFGIAFSETQQGIHRINIDHDGKIWMVLFDNDNNYEIGYSRLVDGQYQWVNQQFIPYSKEIVHVMYHEKNGITWLGGPSGLLRYDNNQVNNYNMKYQTLVRSVLFGDSTIFAGSFGDENGVQLHQPENLVYELDYSSNKPIEFQFASTSYFDESLTQYSFILEGHDDDWSEWSNRTIKQYYLSEGKYTFKVKARNIYGNESEEATFSIIVLPPWYRTTWAYVLYIIGFIIVVYSAIRLSIQRVKKQNIRLEGIVEERTKEVVAQKAEAEKQRDIAEHQKELIEEKNKEILDSISYAKRLQEAILPPEKFVKQNLPNSFVYYKPKDIVAGDFYWMEKVGEEEVFFAAADCTGHGVPGAMVSVVCSNAMDRSVKEFKITNTGNVLDKVTDLVIETFEKSEDEVKDGMDIALCKMKYSADKESATIEFAGANNPFWVVTRRSCINEGEEANMEIGGTFLHEIKPTKQPVGQYDKRVPFQSHTITLQKGEVFYLFTDGYADQFGGPRGKKYKYKPFKRFLISMFDQSMNDQANLLNKEFNAWKGDFEQVDDVCVIGVRV